jgi:hypothetical protein
MQDHTSASTLQNLHHDCRNCNCSRRILPTRPDHETLKKPTLTILAEAERKRSSQPPVQKDRMEIQKKRSALQKLAAVTTDLRNAQRILGRILHELADLAIIGNLILDAMERQASENSEERIHSTIRACWHAPEGRRRKGEGTYLRLRVDIGEEHVVALDGLAGAGAKSRAADAHGAADGQHPARHQPHGGRASRA